MSLAIAQRDGFGSDAADRGVEQTKVVVDERFKADAQNAAELFDREASTLGHDSTGLVFRALGGLLQFGEATDGIGVDQDRKSPTVVSRMTGARGISRLS